MGSAVPENYSQKLSLILSLLFEDEGLRLKDQLSFYLIAHLTCTATVKFTIYGIYQELIYHRDALFQFT